MAGVSVKAIKNRIKSIESTMQITRAMELVSSSKLQKTKKLAENSAVVRNILIDTLHKIGKDPGINNSVFFTEAKENKDIYVIIGGDRGLAGGFNSNLFRAVSKHAGHKNIRVIPFGKKALEYCKSRAYSVLSEKHELTAGVSPDDCQKTALLLKDMFISGEINHIYIAYNKFTSVLVQEPAIETVLPVKSEGQSRELTIYEPSADEMLETAITHYLSTYIYCTVCESVAAEHAARRNAMSAANKNGADMTADLRLQYNRARQAIITQELTEIVAGADAL